MKRTIIGLLGAIVLIGSIGIASAKTTTSPAVASAIKLYKAGDYSQSYIVLNNIVAKDPSNALAYYYLAMSSVQIGKKDEAISNYDKAISLAPVGQINVYAKKGKLCIENPVKCHVEEEISADTEEAKEDRFIRSKNSSAWSEQVRNQYEVQKIQNMMREMNRNEDIAPQKFRDYKDFSSQAPTDEEIVSAIRTLQSAGLGNIIGSGYNSDLSLLGVQSSSNNDMLNMLLNKGNGNLSPQLIQSLLSSQMTANF